MFSEDLTAFFTDFADTALLGAVEVSGIFDADYVDALNVEGSGPAFTLQTSDAAGAVHGSTLVVTSGLGVGSYIVRGVKPDGTGVTTLKLEAQ